MEEKSKENIGKVVVKEDAKKAAEVLDQVAKMLRGDPTAGVYSMYVVAIVVEMQR